MPDWLTLEWADKASALSGLLPHLPGADGVVSLAVSGGGRREAAFRWSYKAGMPGEAGSDVEPDLSMTMASQDAVEVLSGRVEPSVAFMRGRLKTAGDNGMLLLFLDSTNSAEFGRWREAVAALAPETSGTVT